MLILDFWSFGWFDLFTRLKRNISFHFIQSLDGFVLSPSLFVITWIQFLWLPFSQILAFCWIGGQLEWQVTFLFSCHVEILKRGAKIVISFSVLLQVFHKLRLCDAVQEKEHELEPLGKIPLFGDFICHFPRNFENNRLCFFHSKVWNKVNNDIHVLFNLSYHQQS